MHTLVRSRVFRLEFANPFQELLSPALLEHAHGRRAQSFTCVGRHLGHSGLGTLSLLDVATGNLLELEVSRNIGRNQNVRQLAICHQQLRHQIHVPVVDAAILLPGLLAGGDGAVFLEKLSQNRVLVMDKF